MAELIIEKKKILSNILKLDNYFKKNGITWSLVAKLLSGHKEVLESILLDENIKRLHSIGDSRLTGLKVIKKIDPNLCTIYLKPPASDNIKSVVQYADISLNTQFDTINLLNEEAKKQNKTHRIIIMIELGEIREGVMRENFVDFYQRVFELSNIEVIGLGTNLGCMYGIEPTYDKLLQLCLYKQLIEAKFGKKLELVSGGSSITIPLIMKKKLPAAVNHLRVGETAFFGNNLHTAKRFRELSENAFSFAGTIIELEEKEIKPDGLVSDASIGHTAEEEEIDAGNESEAVKMSHRAILDFGILDVNYEDLEPKDKNVKFAGTTSDMTVYDIGKNTKKKYKVGDKVYFKTSYMAVARLMNSKFIEKIIK